MNDKTDTTILLDIYERLGSIEAKMGAVEKYEPRIVQLEKFEGKISAYIWVGGSIVSGVLFFLWEGIKYVLENGIGQWLHR